MVWGRFSSFTWVRLSGIFVGVAVVDGYFLGFCFVFRMLFCVGWVFIALCGRLFSRFCVVMEVAVVFVLSVIF